MSTKAEWLAKGEEIGRTASDDCFRIGEWLCFGEENFLPQRPTDGGKKALRLYLANRRSAWEKLLSEASSATHLSETSLRQYARVVRRKVKVEGLTFAHHLEACRAHTVDEKGKRHFDATGALWILTKAKEQGWTVNQTRAEAQRQWPESARAVEPFDLVRSAMDKLLKGTSFTIRISIYEQLIADAREQIKLAEDNAKADVALFNTDF